MDQFDELIKGWQETTIDSAEDQHVLINKQNQFIMDSIIQYVNQEKEKTENAKKILRMGIMIFPVFLLFYVLLTYFRGTDIVTYNLSELIIGVFLIILGLVLAYYLLDKHSVPSSHDRPTKNYLIDLKQSFINKQKITIPYFIMLMLSLPLGLALFLKSVFVISLMSILIPFGIYLIAIIVFTQIKHGPKQRKVMNEIDGLLVELQED